MKNLSYKKAHKGFTLVELVIVIAIIGILAAVLVPTMMHYIKKAKERAAIAEAKIIVTAAEASVASCPADGTHAILINKPFTDSHGNEVIVGRITNWMVGHVQNGHTIGENDENYVDYLIAKDIVRALTSENKSIDFYKFNGSERNPINMTARQFKNQQHCTGFLMAYQDTGNVFLLEYSRDDFFVRYADGNYNYYNIDDPKSRFSYVRDAR